MSDASDPQTDREWLMRIDGKVDKLLECQVDHEERIRVVEKQNLRWLGRDGAIAVALGVGGGALIGAILWIFGVGR